MKAAVATSSEIPTPPASVSILQDAVFRWDGTSEESSVKGMERCKTARDIEIGKGRNGAARAQ